MTSHAHAPIAVYGASGHTGRFVINELRRRGIPLVAVSRTAPAAGLDDLDVRQASIADAAALDRAFAGCSVVVNCAGPFLDTARPVVAAALRAGCAYIDVTAEQASAAMLFEAFDAPAREAGVAVVPAAGFYGGLADLLASALIGKGTVESIVTAIALSHWWPTQGTLRTGERNKVPRVVVQEGERVPMPLPAATSVWTFAEPFGEQAMVEIPFSEIVTMSRHLPARSMRSHLNARALDEIHDPATPRPSAVDAQGRSAQRFVMETVVVDARGSRRAWATGQDIYALSGQMLVEAAARLREGLIDRRGALALGQLVDAREFMSALGDEHLAFGIDTARQPT
jgi:hypothetical protein